jgi:hypothetical protein
MCKSVFLVFLLHRYGVFCLLGGKMNKQLLKEMLSPCFTAGVATTSQIAAFLNLSYRTISGASEKGKLRKIDRGVYNIDDVANWLCANPRYIAKITK